jgi:hypothetical protein
VHAPIHTLSCAFPYMLSCTSALVASYYLASCVRFCRQPEPYKSRRRGSSLSLVLQEGVLSFNMPEYHSLPCCCCATSAMQAR